MKIDFNDLLIVPEIISKIKSRKEVNPYYELLFLDKHLPIIAAPMISVIDLNNIYLFHKNNLNYCIPRVYSKKLNELNYNNNYFKFFTYKNTMGFVSYDLKSFIDEFINKTVYKPYNYILIDVANGHMEQLVEVVDKFKKKYNKQYYKLMVGNIAHPETYRILSQIGADFIRIGIGNGNGCLTTEQLGIGYPMASLIKECYAIKKELIKKDENAAMIVADGGMKGYSDIIKALALGADYVMIGSLLNKCLESAGDTYFMGIKINQYSKLAKWLFKNKFKLTKKFYGMSTKYAQKLEGKENLKTSEGIIKFQKVEYTLDGWVENFIDYLSSAMSYTNKENLKEFIGNVELIEISQNSYFRFHK